MKHLKKVIFVFALFAMISVNAQDENNPWSLDVGINAVDAYPTNNTSFGTGKWFDEFVNVDNFNILPSISPKFSILFREAAKPIEKPSPKYLPTRTLEIDGRMLKLSTLTNSSNHLPVPKLVLLVG